MRPMTRLFYAARPPFERQPKDCSCMASLSVPRAASRPDFEPKVSGSGSQRVPLLTIMSDNGGGRAVLKGGENTGLLCADVIRKACVGVAREFEELSSQCKAKTKNIAARLRASRQYEGPDLTGRRGSFTRSSLLGFVIGQIREHEATSFSRSHPCEFSPIPSGNGWHTPRCFHLSLAWSAGLPGEAGRMSRTMTGFASRPSLK